MRKLQMRGDLLARRIFAAAPDRHNLRRAGERGTAFADNAASMPARVALSAEIGEARIRNRANSAAPIQCAVREREVRG